jgi:hypothetical protein
MKWTITNHIDTTTSQVDEVANDFFYPSDVHDILNGFLCNHTKVKAKVKVKAEIKVKTKVKAEIKVKIKIEIKAKTKIVLT